MVRAIYEETNEVCFVNIDFVVDIFPVKDPFGNIIKYRAYTFDNERGGYLIDKEDLKFVTSESSDQEEQ